MLEKWNQFKKDLKSEYDMIVQMHATLLQLEDFPPGSVQPPTEDFYEVDGFREPKQQPPQKPSSAAPQSAKRANDAKKPRVPTASHSSAAKKANEKFSGAGTPSVTKSVQPQMLKFKSQLPTAAAGGVSHSQNDLNPALKRKQSDNRSEQKEGFDRMVDHFKMLPFQHHHMPDQFPDEIPDSKPFNEPVVSHQMFVKQPAPREEPG